MNRIGAKFDELKRQGKKALITFITAGVPSLEATERIIREMERKGADLVEIGIPYSDPVAEGPVIQEADRRALLNGIKIRDIMESVQRLRETVRIPLLYMMYFNCILQYGIDGFFSDCRKNGIDGVIIPDLPFEEKGEVEGIAEKYGIDLISLVSPVSKDRTEMIASEAKGFLYCVSSLGVTGVRSTFSTNFEEFFKDIDKYAKVPTAIGFGISNEEHVRALKGYCDGIIVGSAIVREVIESRDAGEAVRRAGEITGRLRAALDAE